MSIKAFRKQVSAASPVYLVQVYDAAKAYGDSTSSMIALLKSGKVIWGNAESVEPIAQAFREGGMSGRLGVKRDVAKGILALKRYLPDSKDPDQRRTLPQQMAYRATISAWSYCATQAGKPGTAPKKRSAQTQPPVIVADNKSTAPTVLERVIVPHATTFDDVRQFSRSMAALMRKFENKNAKTSFGEYRGVIDAFVNAVESLGKAEAVIKPAT